ncbi:MAG: HesA/MoeB/ThiF family protein [Planctomycetaceae bacterium]|nr:HesA/MoeB/ThiF family protein [Planctomycetaceae bacterium]
MITELERYTRQTLFPPLSKEGQWLLQQGRVLIVGCGALGGTIADLLVRAGVGKDNGRITLLDPDIVQLSNLHRQVLFTEEDAQKARLKVEAARDAVLKADHTANIEVLPILFDEHNRSMVAEHDVLVDATDNFPARFLMNRAAVQYRKPFITAGVTGASGQTMTILPGETACLECFLKNPVYRQNRPPEDVIPILGPLPMLFGALEALEVIKILSGNLVAVNRSLFALDLWNNRNHRFDVGRDNACPVCGCG